MKASRIFKEKPVNSISQTWNSDGTVSISIFKEGWKKPYVFKAKNLNSKQETILEDEEVTE